MGLRCRERVRETRWFLVAGVVATTLVGGCNRPAGDCREVLPGAYSGCQDNSDCDCGHCVEVVTDPNAGSAYGWGKCAPECLVDLDCVVVTPEEYPPGAVSVLDPGYECRENVCRRPPVSAFGVVNFRNAPSDYIVQGGGGCTQFAFSTATASFVAGRVLAATDSFLLDPATLGTCVIAEDAIDRYQDAEVVSAGNVEVVDAPPLANYVLPSELGWDGSSHLLGNDGHWYPGLYRVRVGGNDVVPGPFEVEAPVVAPISFDRSVHDGTAVTLARGDAFTVAWGSAVYVDDLECNPPIDIKACETRPNLDDCTLTMEAVERLSGAPASVAIVSLESADGSVNVACKAPDDGLHGTFTIPGEITAQFQGDVTFSVTRLYYAAVNVDGFRYFRVRSGSTAAETGLLRIE